MLLQLESHLQKEQDLHPDSQSNVSFQTKKFWLKKAGQRLPVFKGFQSSVGHQLFERFNSFKQPDPGPGSYDPFIKEVQRELQKNRKIPPLGGSVKRSFLNESSILPGPGSYQISCQSQHKKSQRIVLKSLCKQTEKTQYQVPGPGYYSNDLTRSSSDNRYRHIFILPSEKKRPEKKQSELQVMIAENRRSQEELYQKPVIRKHKKKHESSTNKVYLPRYLIDNTPAQVGPGSYNVGLPDMRPHYMRFKNTANFMYADRPQDPIADVPGPGHYQSNLTGKKGVSFKFIKSQKSSAPKQQGREPVNQKLKKNSQVALPKQKVSFHYNLHQKWV